MKSNKGQALLEFILILPILLMFILAMIDFGRIIYEMNRLEGITNDAVTLIKNETLRDSEIEAKLKHDFGITLTLIINRKDQNTILKLRREIDIITPGVDSILPDPYTVEVSRVIHNE